MPCARACQDLKSCPMSCQHANGRIIPLLTFNTLRLRQNGCYFPDDIFKVIFLNEKVWILIRIPLKFVFKGPVINIPALVQIMDWSRPGDKPLSEPMMLSLLMHICLTRHCTLPCPHDNGSVIRQLVIKPLRPNDTIWRHTSRSTLVQAMACCLMAPNHYLNQCWLIICGVRIWPF